jgi:hypothetical protein
MLLYPDYKSQVVQYYQKKMVDNLLHSGLIDPTPARLRDACLEICRDRYSEKDERTLKEFFGQGSDKVACLRAIERLEASKFKPLAKFLNKGSGSTERKNIELLAWLIDFQPRPFVFNELPNPDKTVARQDENLKDGPKGDSTPADEPPARQEKISHGPSAPNPSARKIKIGIVALVILIIAVVGIGNYWSRTNKPPKYSLTGHEACMFWDEDRYQPISCKPHGDTLVVALDSNKLLHFRKITQPDTITPNAIGSVWYVKYRKGYEFYTGDGFHPIDPNLRLRPITEFIIRNHVPPEQ